MLCQSSQHSSDVNVLLAQLTTIRWNATLTTMIKEADTEDKLKYNDYGKVASHALQTLRNAVAIESGCHDCTCRAVMQQCKLLRKQASIRDV